MTTKRDHGVFLPDLLIEGFNSHHPSDEAVHEQTIKYIREDFHENSHKYSAEDWVRISSLIF